MSDRPGGYVGQAADAKVEERVTVRTPALYRAKTKTDFKQEVTEIPFGAPEACSWQVCYLPLLLFRLSASGIVFLVLSA